MTYMSKEFREWLKALRSGDYTQCADRLRDGDAYCCLGVGLDLSHLGAWKKEYKSSRYVYSIIRKGSCDILPPKELWEYMKIQNKGDIKVFKEMLSKKGYQDTGIYHQVVDIYDILGSVCSIFNDERMPFTEIADYLESMVDKGQIKFTK